MVLHFGLDSRFEPDMLFFVFGWGLGLPQPSLAKSTIYSSNRFFSLGSFGAAGGSALAPESPSAAPASARGKGPLAKE